MLYSFWVEFVVGAVGERKQVNLVQVVIFSEFLYYRQLAYVCTFFRSGCVQ